MEENQRILSHCIRQFQKYWFSSILLTSPVNIMIYFSLPVGSWFLQITRHSIKAVGLTDNWPSARKGRRNFLPGKGWVWTALWGKGSKKKEAEKFTFLGNTILLRNLSPNKYLTFLANQQGMALSKEFFYPLFPSYLALCPSIELFSSKHGAEIWSNGH